MDVEVGDGLAAVRAVVDDHAVSVLREAELGGDVRGGEEKVAEDGSVIGGRCAHAGDGFVRDDEDVDGCLRGNVAESEAGFVTMDHIRRDLGVADFLENRLHWGRNLAGEGRCCKREKVV